MRLGGTPRYRGSRIRPEWDRDGFPQPSAHLIYDEEDPKGAEESDDWDETQDNPDAGGGLPDGSAADDGKVLEWDQSGDEHRYVPGSPYLDVTHPDYGADITGSDDSRAAIQAAIDAALGGTAYGSNIYDADRIVYLPPGIYKVTPASTTIGQRIGLSVRSARGLKFIGAGPNATIIRFVGTFEDGLLLEGVADCSFEDIQFEGSGGTIKRMVSLFNRYAATDSAGFASFTTATSQRTITVPGARTGDTVVISHTFTNGAIVSVTGVAGTNQVVVTITQDNPGVATGIVTGNMTIMSGSANTTTSNAIRRCRFRNANYECGISIGNLDAINDPTLRATHGTAQCDGTVLEDILVSSDYSVGTNTVGPSGLAITAIRNGDGNAGNNLNLVCRQVAWNNVKYGLHSDACSFQAHNAQPGGAYEDFRITNGIIGPTVIAEYRTEQTARFLTTSGGSSQFLMTVRDCEANLHFLPNDGSSVGRWIDYRMAGRVKFENLKCALPRYTPIVYIAPTGALVADLQGIQQEGSGWPTGIFCNEQVNLRAKDIQNCSAGGTLVSIRRTWESGGGGATPLTIPADYHYGVESDTEQVWHSQLTLLGNFIVEGTAVFL